MLTIHINTHMYISVPPVSQFSFMYFLAVSPQTVFERQKENSRSVWMLCVAQCFENWFSKQFEQSKGENENRVHHGSAEGGAEHQRLRQTACVPWLWCPPMSSGELLGGHGLHTFRKLVLFALSCNCSHLKSLTSPSWQYVGRHSETEKKNKS